MVPDMRTPVGQLIAEHPEWACVFDRLRIDYCCGGKAPFDEVCAGLGLDVGEVVRQLESCVAGAGEGEYGHGEADWSHATVEALIEHIVTEHHGYLRRELPRLDEQVRLVDQLHGGRYPWIRGLRTVFGEFRTELESHLLREEQVFFPLLRRLDARKEGPGADTEDLGVSIHDLEHEHFEVAAALGRFRALTDDYKARLEGCETYRALLDGLAALEIDLRHHVHEENNFLFAGLGGSGRK